MSYCTRLQTFWDNIEMSSLRLIHSYQQRLLLRDTLEIRYPLEQRVS